MSGVDVGQLLNSVSLQQWSMSVGYSPSGRSVVDFSMSMLVIDLCRLFQSTSRSVYNGRSFHVCQSVDMSVGRHSW